MFMKTKALIAAAVAVPLVAAASLITLGAEKGKGPLKFLKEKELAKLPGNNAMYHPQYLKKEDAAPQSSLAGKKLLFLGSSVCAGAGSLGVTMADYLAIQDGCEVTNEAVSGTTMADVRGDSYLARLKQLDPSVPYDAIIVQLSASDAAQGMELGSISASRDPRTFDTKTTIGSIEAIIAYCQAVWGCPVLFYTGTRFENEGYQALVEAFPAIAEKWGVGTIDLWNDTEMNAVSVSDYKYYMSDPIHPTQAGYLLWWTPKFREALKKVLA